ncbi:MAG: lipopolysaccharide heptosyltransferase II [Calditrichaeota bacterium]|nr:lipopolysaccharide heptosyltransferase II [Calditrichota bacterium]
MSLAPSAPQRILVFQTAFLGDAILTIPLIEALKDRFPAALIDIVVIPGAVNILETLPYINAVIPFDKRGNGKGLKGLLGLAALLRRRNYDLALVPHRSFRTALLVKLSRITFTLSFDRSAGAFLYSQTVPYRRDFHEINRNLALGTPLGLDPLKQRFPKVYPTPEDRQKVSDWLDGAALKTGQPLIALAPGSVWNTKRWPAERFGRLAGLLARGGFQPVMIGGPADVQTGAAVEAVFGGPLPNAIGQLTLRESAALLERCNALITNDSAPLHLAVATATPVVAIFGATVTEFGFYPYHPDDMVVETAGLSCRPCGAHGGHKCPIGTFECMLNIEASRVFEALKMRLKDEN